MDQSDIKAAQKSLPLIWKFSRIGKTLDKLPEITEPDEQLVAICPSQTVPDDPDSSGTAYMIVATDRRVLVLRAGLSGTKDFRVANYDQITRCEPTGKKGDGIALAGGEISLENSAPKQFVAPLVAAVNARREDVPTMAEADRDPGASA